MTAFQNILTLETYQMKNLTRDVQSKMTLRPQDIPAFSSDWRGVQVAIVEQKIEGIITDSLMKTAYKAMQFEYLKNGLSPNIRKAALAVAGIRELANG